MKRGIITVGIALLSLLIFYMISGVLFETRVYQNDRLLYNQDSLRLKIPENISDEDLHQIITRHFLKPQKVTFKNGVVARNEVALFHYFKARPNHKLANFAWSLYYDAKSNQDSLEKYVARQGPEAGLYFRLKDDWKRTYTKEDKKQKSGPFLLELSQYLNGPVYGELMVDLYKKIAVEGKKVSALWEVYPHLNHYYKYRLTHSLDEFISFYAENKRVFLYALLTIVPWFCFFIWSNVFDRSKALFYLLALILGMVSTLVLFDPIADVFYGLSYMIGDNLLVRCVIGIGITEELTKIIPVVLMIIVFRRRLELLDILIIGTMSGLGFASIENAGKLYQYSIEAFDTRSVLCAISHACYTAIISYQIIVSIKLNKGYIWRFGVGLSISAIIHGLWDLIVFSDMRDRSLLFYMGVYVMFAFLVPMISNTLNLNSRFIFPKGGYIPRVQSAIVFTLILAWIIDLTYTGTEYGSSALRSKMGTEVLGYTVFIGLLIHRFTYFSLIRGYWKGLSLESIFKKVSAEPLIRRTFVLKHKSEVLGKGVVFNQDINEDGNIVFKLRPESSEGVLIPEEFVVLGFLNDRINFEEYAVAESKLTDHSDFKFKLKYE